MTDLEDDNSEVMVLNLIRSRGVGVEVTRTTRSRGEVHLVRLDPTLLGSEIQKTRPCLVVSPDELNQYLRTVIVAPMTTGGRAYPWRVACRPLNFRQRGPRGLTPAARHDGQTITPTRSRPTS